MITKIQSVVSQRLSIEQVAGGTDRSCQEREIELVVMDGLWGWNGSVKWEGKGERETRREKGRDS